MDDFLELKGTIIPKEELTEEQIPYYNYTCQPGDYIKTCSVPSPLFNEKDLEREKKDAGNLSIARNRATLQPGCIPIIYLCIKNKR